MTVFTHLKALSEHIKHLWVCPVDVAYLLHYFQEVIFVLLESWAFQGLLHSVARMVIGTLVLLEELLPFYLGQRWNRLFRNHRDVATQA